MGTVDDLFKRVVETSQKAPTDTFYREWMQVMSHYEPNIVETAWLKIRIRERWTYYDLKTWVDVCDAIHEERKLDAEISAPKPERPKVDRIFVSDCHEATKIFINQDCTRNHLLEIYRKLGISTAERLAYYDKWGLDLNENLGVQSAQLRKMVKQKFPYIYESKSL